MKLLSKIPLDPRVEVLLSKVIATSSTPLPQPDSQTEEGFRSILLPETVVFRDTKDGFFPYIVNGQDKFISAAGHLIGADRCSNAIIYPAMSIMDWHTNSDQPGIRTYYTYTEGRAVFRYYLDGEYYEDEDNIGWTARQFVIDPEKPLWHTIWTEKHRYAFGFNTYFKS